MLSSKFPDLLSNKDIEFKTKIWELRLSLKVFITSVLVPEKEGDSVTVAILLNPISDEIFVDMIVAFVELFKLLSKLFIR